MTKPTQFEKSLSELQKIVAQLEQGDLTLEESLKQFEKGITLVKKCEEALNQAEQKIESLSESKTATSDESNE
ncbi:exodeoxyribonuclease VII small subunit [Legionella yabuuchiae]|uniref:exodeoxyribonuclease VII small subunit n=1 Tax=Legionella yabuuchiae TaxID=376727 RepID=UPI001A94D495|nr:exodeoxyribonuclease VII small subunit [Legionella yabuuchiae]